MKFFKTSLVIGAIALLAAPAVAQYGREDEEAAASAARSAPSGIGGYLREYLRVVKAVFIGGETAPEFSYEDPNSVLFNITDSNYRDTIFNDEWVVAFLSSSSAPSIDYFPTFWDAALTMQNETSTKFAAVWVENCPHIAARFFVPSRLPYVLYAKDGEFRHIPYQRNDTQFLIDFIEDERYQYYPVLSGPLNPYSTLAMIMVKYADILEWIGRYTYWMPKWMTYVLAGTLSGAIFQFFSGGSNYSSDPAKYPHLNADGTLKKTFAADATANSTSTSTSTSTKTKSSKSSSSTKKRSTKKAEK
ncbi:hypothetical protein BGZ80_011368 [Entomortierella chlamydospora]|uniref:Thioredoxin domain-containing protein n=1 Tax=Entomortierella chlamydospora TaxID=101097 RepID=A0A9P6MU84_9FUNG|nr:hypothetical protein BGZ79_001421 [Entomortierella chlamydospora]KAG0013000.1 hypothetical protein BGZ80_011368 [Entomortierella chlamydospora]